jgi:hypothetical protein
MDELQELLEDSAGGMTLEAWVTEKCNSWRYPQEANYFNKWNEYYRIWRGVWAEEDKERSSERSKLISPATQQAVESSASELEEATFGRGAFFDIKDEEEVREKAAVLKKQLQTEFKKHGIRKEASECILNAAVFGTGIAEVVMDTYDSYTPATANDDGIEVVGRITADKTCVKMRPIKPHNFRIPDTATSIEDALGVGIEEFVSPDYVYENQENGIYMDTDFLMGGHVTDEDLEADPTLAHRPDDKVRLLRYYGKVPRHLLEEVEGFEATQNHDEDSYYTEAVVVIANNGILLKAIDNPYLMNDRPVVSFQWDIVPGRFWGRGICEKGYNPQKALDAELRQRRDAMAMNVAPMLGVDATRLPMLGQKLEVTPGKQVLTQGDPREVLHPFRFGDLPPTSYQETDSLSKMVQMATGAVDSAGIAGQINGEATAAGISMSLGAIIKRHKRTLINFQESFLIPFVRKAAWRYMQFDPEKFPTADYDFVVTSSLGIMAREYEVGQMTSLLQTTSPDSPLYSIILESIVDNMNLSNREEMIQALRKAGQPSQQEQMAQEEQRKMQMELHELQKSVLKAQAAESNARAQKYLTEAKLAPVAMQVDMVDAIADVNNDAADDFEKSMQVAKQDFDEKMAVAEFALKEKQATQTTSNNDTP